VIAHRGGGARAPENTLEAMQLAIADGADGIEFDVRLSADGDAVVIHDPTVDRTTNGIGRVDQLTVAELKSLDAGFRFDARASDPLVTASHRIPTLNEVLERLPGVPLLIEIKLPAAAAATRRLIERHQAQDRCVVGSFSEETMSVFRGSGIARIASRSGVLRLMLSGFTGGLFPIPGEISALSIPRQYNGLPLPVSSLARSMRSAGKPTHIWTVNDPDEARTLWELGAIGMVTDDVPSILAARSRNPG
jgi:glycerophosphoryl diester phosphodiesterase